MNRDAILARLRENEPALRTRGVAHAALFGSHARGEAGPDSDTDIMIELNPEVPIGVWDYVGLSRDIASLFGGHVDVIDRDGLDPSVRAEVESEAVYAF